jgi:hypothetical protein
MNQESFMSGHHTSSRTIGTVTRFALCLVAPLALAGCSSRKGEMLSAIRHEIGKPGNRLVYVADLKPAHLSQYTNTGMHLNLFAPGFAKTISPAHPIVDVTAPGDKLSGIQAYWMKHHDLRLESATVYNGLTASSVTVYLWKHHLPKGLGGTVPILVSTGQIGLGLLPGYRSKRAEVPWITSFAGGRVSAERIASFTTPTASHGITISHVSVVLKLHDIPDFLRAKPVTALLGHRAPDRTMTRTVTMEETSGGWKLLHARGFVPMIEERHVARFRKMLVSGLL